MAMEQQTQERMADSLTTITVGSWAVTLADINLILETATFFLGFVAGCFAVFFHIRRYFRSRARDKAAEQDD